MAPQQVKEILEKEKDIKILVQPSKKRVFADCEYIEVGAILSEDLSECQLIIGVKEIPIDKFMADKTFMYFSHTIKVFYIILYWGSIPQYGSTW